MAIGWIDISGEVLTTAFKKNRFEVIGGLPDDAKLLHIRSLKTRAGAGGGAVDTYRMVFESQHIEDQKAIDPPAWERIA